MNPFRIGLALLSLGGAFWLGQCRGVGEADQLREINDWNRMAFYGWTSHARTSYDHRLKAEAELRDCNDAMTMWQIALERRAGVDREFTAEHPLPGFRFLNPEGEIVTYHVPPPRKRTGAALPLPSSVRRDAGWTP